jgi:3-phenylpropionate/trans-cinnamate dioxygenase ferredoxin subunit
LRRSLGRWRRIYSRSTTSIGDMSKSSRDEWIRVCSIDEIKEGEVYPFDIKGKELMLVKYNGNVYALDRICTHQYADLSMGFVSEGEIVCPLHLARFRLTDGIVTNPPADIPLNTYNIKIDGGVVYINVKCDRC